MPSNNVGNKNTMLPTYNATYENMCRALNDGTISSPCWVFVEDRNDLCFIHFDTVDGVRKLVPHILLWEKMSVIETQLEGLVDPETGEPVNVVDYVNESVTPVAEQVETVTTDVEEIKKNGAAIMITYGGDA